MNLVRYNKFFFDVYSDKQEYLNFNISILRAGGRFFSFLHLEYSRPDTSGKYLPAFIYKTKLKLIDKTEDGIKFFEGEISFKEDMIKVVLSTVSLLIKIEFTKVHQESRALTGLKKRISRNNLLLWTPLQIKSLVNGVFITANNSLELINASGYTDMVKIIKFPFKIPISKLLWGRLHNEEIDLTYSLIISNNSKSVSKLFLCFEKNISEFSNIDYLFQNENISTRLSIKYPERILLTAKNEIYGISIDIFNHTYVITDQFMDNKDLIGRFFSSLLKKISGKSKGIKFLARADIILKNNLTTIEFYGLPLISEYVSFKS